jgi:prepilin-type N-terminal cleavage/methylation domain-containing protein
MIRPERQAGFSLIEALVSMVLISVASGALISSINNASRNSAARFEALALALAAQDRLIELQSGRLSDGARGERIDDDNVRWVYEIQSLGQDENRRGARLYRVSLAIYMPDAADNPRMKIETYAIGH